MVHTFLCLSEEQGNVPSSKKIQPSSEGQAVSPECCWGPPPHPQPTSLSHRSSRYFRYSEQSCWVPGLNHGVQDAERKFSGEMAGL